MQVCTHAFQNSQFSRSNSISYIWTNFKELFRELGGARLAHNMVPYRICRDQALTIVSSLLLNTAGEDDMSTLLGLMHTAKLEDLDLKNSVLTVSIDKFNALYW